MPEEPAIYHVEIPLVISHEIGRDPDALPDHTLLQMKGTRALQLCESLFWVVRQLGLFPEHGGQVYSPQALHEALADLGQLGQALASAAGGHLQYLEQLVERERRQKRKR
jgi:hypothetical protein